MKNVTTVQKQRHTTYILSPQKSHIIALKVINHLPTSTLQSKSPHNSNSEYVPNNPVHSIFFLLQHGSIAANGSNMNNPYNLLVGHQKVDETEYGDLLLCSAYNRDVGHISCSIEV